MGEREIARPQRRLRAGRVTYEMLTGEPPFTGLNAQAIVAKVLTEKPAAPSRAQRATVPGRRRRGAHRPGRSSPPIASPPRRTSPTPSTAARARATPRSLRAFYPPCPPSPPPSAPRLIARRRTDRHRRGRRRLAHARTPARRTRYPLPAPPQPRHSARLPRCRRRDLRRAVTRWPAGALRGEPRATANGRSTSGTWIS